MDPGVHEAPRQTVDVAGGAAGQGFFRQGLAVAAVQTADDVFDARHGNGVYRQAVHGQAQKHGQAIGVRGHFPAHGHGDVRGVPGLHNLLDGREHGRVQGLINVSHLVVIAVHPQGVLHQIVGADAEKVRFFGQGSGHESRGRQFHHDAHRQILDAVQALVAQFAAGFLHGAHGPLEFQRVAEHGEHQGGVALRSGSEHGPQLHFEQVRVGQAIADAAQAQGRVGLHLALQVGHDFVRSHVQGAEADLAGRGGQGRGIFLIKLFFLGRRGAVEKSEFRAVQAHAFGSVDGHIGDVLPPGHVGLDLDRIAVRGAGGHGAGGLDALAVSVELRGQGAVFFNFRFIRVDQHSAFEAVHNDGGPVGHAGGQGHDPHHAGQAQSPGQNAGVRGFAAFFRDQADDVLGRKLQGVGRGKVMRQQGRVGRQAYLAALVAGKLLHNAVGHQVDFLDGLPDIGVFYFAESLGDFGQGFVHGPFRAHVQLADALRHAPAEFGVLGDHDVRGQDGGLVFHFIGQAGVGVFQISHHIGQGGFEFGDFFVHLLRFDGLADGGGFAPGAQEKGLADGDARRNRNAVQNARGHYFQIPALMISVSVLTAAAASGPVAVMVMLVPGPADRDRMSRMLLASTLPASLLMTMSAA